MCGSIEFSAANIQRRYFGRALSSPTASGPPSDLQCAEGSRRSRTGPSPSSSYAGTCPNGCIARYLSDFWSSGPINHASYGNPASSSAHRTLRSRTKPRAKVGTQRKALIRDHQVLQFYVSRSSRNSRPLAAWFRIHRAGAPRPWSMARRLRRGPSAQNRGNCRRRREYRDRGHRMNMCAALHRRRF